MSWLNSLKLFFIGETYEQRHAREDEEGQREWEEQEARNASLHLSPVHEVPTGDPYRTPATPWEAPPSQPPYVGSTNGYGVKGRELGSRECPCPPDHLHSIGMCPFQPSPLPPQARLRWERILMEEEPA